MRLARRLPMKIAYAIARPWAHPVSTTFSSVRLVLSAIHFQQGLEALESLYSSLRVWKWDREFTPPGRKGSDLGWRPAPGCVQVYACPLPWQWRRPKRCSRLRRIAWHPQRIVLLGINLSLAANGSSGERSRRGCVDRGFRGVGKVDQPVNFERSRESSEFEVNL